VKGKVEVVTYTLLGASGETGRVCAGGFCFPAVRTTGESHMQKGRMARILLACVFGLVLTLGGMTGTAAAEGNGIQFMWYDANYGTGGAVLPVR
jgi:hypothetical protein